MKKIKYLLLMTILLIPLTGKAAMHCEAPSSVESGETFGVRFYGSIGGPAPIWFAKLAGEGNVSYSSGNLTVAGEETSDFSRTVYYTAGNPGSAKFYAYDVDVASENDSFSDSDTCTVTIAEATRPNDGFSSSTSSSGVTSSSSEVDPDKSSNSYLKSLSIENIKMFPGFNKDKMDYTAVVPGNVNKINIKGEVEDEKATVEGLGEKELKEGINKFEIKVTAENTEVRTYVLTVTKKEENPIEITINKKKFTVSKKEIGLKVPDGFNKTTVVIEKEEVVAYSNSFTGYIIVALVDEDGNAGWYIYNQKNGTYEKYSEFKSNGIRLIILSPNKKDVPHRYKKSNFELNNNLVEGYALEVSSPFRLIYALNMATGEKGFYLYDMEQNTFQRFYNRQVNIYLDLLKKLEILIIGLAAIILLFFVIILSQLFINKKTKKFIRNGGIVKKEEPVVEDQDLDDEIEEKMSLTKVQNIKQEVKPITPPEVTQPFEPIKEGEPLTRAELKKLKKEEKKKMEEQRKDFFS